MIAERMTATQTSAPSIETRRIGSEHAPLVVIDGFAPEPDALRAAACAAPFVAAGEHYPGLRAPLPSEYLATQLPIVAAALGRSFGRFRRISVVDASFSMVTTAPTALAPRQRVPHVDAYGRERVALIHYLSLDNMDGTAFFRHRATGFETIDAQRAAGFFAALDDELRDPESSPTGYIAGDTALFDRTTAVDARYNRALLYRSHLLHSGAIAPDALLSPDPSTGRLTITAFLALE